MLPVKSTTKLQHFAVLRYDFTKKQPKSPNPSKHLIEAWLPAFYKIYLSGLDSKII
jgi:hypothetical protein